MAIPYKKQFVKSDGRKLNRSGPRDMQSRASGSGYVQDNSLAAEIATLRSEIIALKSRPDSPAPAGFFTPEQVDDEIRKAVESAVAEAAVAFKGGGSQGSDLEPLVKEYKSQILELQKGNDNLTILHSSITKENSEFKENIKKLEMELSDVSDLKKQIAVLEQEVSGKDELIEALKTRPVIVGDEIIDPERPQMEQLFIDPLEEDAGEGMKSSINIETITKDDAEVGNKVNKLRDLLGKLPAK